MISEISQKYYKAELEEKLKNNAKLIQLQLSEYRRLGISVDYNKSAKQYSSVLYPEGNSTPLKDQSNYLRVTFIDKSGKVLGESQKDYQTMDNHINRKEVQQALNGEIGKDTRFSRELKLNLLYIAVPSTPEGVITRVSVPLIQLRNIEEIIFIYTGIGVFASIILTAIIAFWFSNRITKPVNELIKVTKDISDGNFSRRSDINLDDEIGELSRTFNIMAEKLEYTLAEMTDKNIKVESIINSMYSGVIAVDNNLRIMLINTISCGMFGIKNGPGVIGMNIIEIVRNNKVNNMLKDTIKNNIPYNAEISIGPPIDKTYKVYATPIKTNSPKQINSGGIVTIHDVTNLKKLEQIRTEFVSNVTHELKTPLTSIRGFIETLKSGAIEDKNVAVKFLDIIDIEAERLSILINDILQLSEIESRQRDSDIACHNIKDIVKEVLDMLQGVSAKKGVKLDVEVEEDIKVNANRNRIKQMLINLIDNAIKYNFENGTVEIRVYKKEAKIFFIVKDNGIGIDDQHIPRIFERFYRVDKGRSRNMGGTGLGLSIVKHIVNSYNGNINITSKPGKGTEFIIQLPA